MAAVVAFLIIDCVSMRHSALQTQSRRSDDGDNSHHVHIGVWKDGMSGEGLRRTSEV